MKYKYKYGFTLAEVLIVLTIIGIVAALTIPAIMQSTQNQETVAKVKKFYSAATQSFTRAQVDNGSVDGWGWTGNGSSAGAQNVLTILAQYFNITQNCGTNSGCLPDVTYKLLNNSASANYSTSNAFAKAQLNDGAIIAIASRSSNCSDNVVDVSNRGQTPALSNVCGLIYFDVNGKSSPNQWGKDLFYFYITKYGVIPVGTPAETTYPPNDCNKTTGNGYACTAWILQKGNMDYLN